MDPLPDAVNDYRGSRMWPVIALGLLAAAWVMYFLIMGYSARLSERWGPAPDVVDALQRDGYGARHILPYLSVVLLLDMLVLGALAPQSRPGWPRVLKVLVAVLLVPTALFHGLAWLVTLFFAN